MMLLRAGAPAGGARFFEKSLFCDDICKIRKSDSQNVLLGYSFHLPRKIKSPILQCPIQIGTNKLCSRTFLLPCAKIANPIRKKCSWATVFLYREKIKSQHFQRPIQISRSSPDGRSRRTLPTDAPDGRSRRTFPADVPDGRIRYHKW